MEKKINAPTKKRKKTPYTKKEKNPNNPPPPPKKIPKTHKKPHKLKKNRTTPHFHWG